MDILTVLTGIALATMSDAQTGRLIDLTLVGLMRSSGTGAGPLPGMTRQRQSM